MPQEISLHDLQNKSKLPVTKAGFGSVKQFFDANKQVIADVLPKHMDPERMLRLATGAIRTNPKLKECTIESLFGAVVLASQFGLEPNTPLGEVYLIPYKVKGAMTVQFQLGYPGKLKLAARSDEIKTINCETIHANDDFIQSLGSHDNVEHVPCFPGDRGPMIGAWAWAHLKDGGFMFKVMSKAEIEAHRDQFSQAYKTALKYNNKDTTWLTSPGWMWKKTVLIQLCKMLPSSIEDARMRAYDAMAERGIDQELGKVLEGVDYDVVMPSGSPDVDAETPTQAAPEPAPEGVDPNTGEDKRGQQKPPEKPQSAKKKTATAAPKPDDGPEQPPVSAYEDAPAPGSDDDLPDLT